MVGFIVLRFEVKIEEMCPPSRGDVVSDRFRALIELVILPTGSGRFWEHPS